MSTTSPAGPSNFHRDQPRKPLRPLQQSLSSSSSKADVDNLWNQDDESFEVQVPDFHFDWGVEKGIPEAKTESAQHVPFAKFSSLSIKSNPSRLSSISPPGPSIAPISTSARSTPPPRLTHSARSSLSSAHVSSLTDASTASASSLAPTPPGSGLSVEVPSAFSHNLEADGSGNGSGSGSGSGGSGRIYGGGRKFQRVVSAPITRQRPNDDEYGLSTIGESFTLSSSNTSHTATMRPGLVHTSSTSSIPLDSSTSTVTRSSNYMTPGVTDRTLTSTARSTGRRLGGLSKFGGPARRVIPATEVEEMQEGLNRSSPVLIDSPPKDGHASLINRDTEFPESVRPSEDLGHAYAEGSSRNPRRSPKQKDSNFPSMISEAGMLDFRPSQESSQTRYEREARSAYQKDEQRAQSPSLSTLSNRIDDVDRPYRPFSSHWEQGNRPSPNTVGHLQHNDHHRANREVAALSSQPMRVSPPPVPSRYSPPPPALRAVRPAPSVIPVEDAQTAPAMMGQQGRTEGYGPPAASIPAQPAATTRTSFLVNSVPYERLQRLGKGGSSTVYSVLYSAPPKKRIIYALKVVQLDRADAETYQSYTNEIELLKRLRGHDRVIQLMDHQITFGQGNRPHRLLMVMECGEIDFAALLDEQRGKAINMNFVGLYWEQAVHKENVVHTDLKPANFVLVKGRLKIIDFGIAKAVANDTVNIQRDQQIGTVNYMSPEAIQRMNNQKVLKYIGGGPLAKMQVIADPGHFIEYAEMAVPKAAVGVSLDGHPIDAASLAVAVSPSAIDSMKRCLAYRKEHRLTIAELLHHEFLKPKIRAPALPPGSTPITQSQMERLVNFILRENDLPELAEGNHTAEDLFSQLEAQNSLSN
ncbi:uncharacterized protein IL334_005903 [Kwoniella shivajii]|uniref:Protein kinase domain-containing protein n=1 Tax=Kwoniella shivajii TaxID=564305 RepID=A0ABZ1D4F0_9TREE|nr:hypothetical protein IL334_005903 [Kwoniella shivajii]